MEQFSRRIFNIESIKAVKFIVDKFIREVTNGTYKIDDLIIIFDSDDTLVTLDLTLGYHKSIAVSYYAKPKKFNQLELENLEFALLIDKVPCEGKTTLEVLDYINIHDVNCLVETSRRLSLLKATFNNFSKNGILERILNNKFYLQRDVELDHLTLYTANILLVSDQPKGIKFRKLCEHIGRKYKIIIIIDDTLSKITSFFDAFPEKEYIVFGCLYTFINKPKKR